MNAEKHGNKLTEKGRFCPLDSTKSSIFHLFWAFFGKVGVSGNSRFLEKCYGNGYFLNKMYLFSDTRPIKEIPYFSG
jgi:hypothetical protein